MAKEVWLGNRMITLQNRIDEIVERYSGARCSDELPLYDTYADISSVRELVLEDQLLELLGSAIGAQEQIFRLLSKSMNTDESGTLLTVLNWDDPPILPAIIYPFELYVEETLSMVQYFQGAESEALEKLLKTHFPEQSRIVRQALVPTETDTYRLFVFHPKQYDILIGKHQIYRATP